MISKTTIWWNLTILFVVATSFSYRTSISFSLGDADCQLIQMRSGDNTAAFVSLHENESTAVKAYEAAKPHLQNTNLFELKQNGTRLLYCKLQGQKYFFDPNRIFSFPGIKKSIAVCNSSYLHGLEYNIKSFADSLLKVIVPNAGNTYIISLHNNTNNHFSVLTYQNSTDADEVFINPTEDIDNFFIVTDKAGFKYFKSLKRNVVLQNKNAEDDGSLSVYCQRNNIPYINIEAQHGHLNQQTQMIREAYSFAKHINEKNNN